MTERTEREHEHEQLDDDTAWMKQAIAEARAAGAAGDVPVGSIVVVDDVVVGRGRNRRQQRGDPTAHAEVEALRDASTRIGNWRIEGTLYVTQEPCPMCAGAIVNARVKRVVYGCANPKAGAVESLYQLLSDPRLNHQSDVRSGVLASDCAELLRSFFAELRSRK